MDTTKEENALAYKRISLSHLFFLKLIALVPLDGHELNFIHTRLLGLYFHTTSFLFYFMWMGYGVRMVLRKSLEVDFICEMITIFASFLRYIILYKNRKKIINLLRLCEDLWHHLRTDEMDILKMFERKAYLLRNFLLISTVGTAIVYIFTTEFLKQPEFDDNGIMKKILPFRFFVDIQDQNIFTIVKICQIIITFSFTILMPSTETVALYLTMMASGYLRSVQNRLLYFKQNQNMVVKVAYPNDIIDTAIFQDVIACARLHQKIMLYCQEIESLTSSIFFVMVFASVYNMSIAGLAILKNDENKFNIVGVFSINVLQFLFCQWSPEILLVESEAIRNAAYFASFPQTVQNEKINRVLIFIMMRTQKPIQLTAAGFIKLSMETFAEMLKSAFSFFALLRSFES